MCESECEKKEFDIKDICLLYLLLIVHKGEVDKRYAKCKESKVIFCIFNKEKMIIYNFYFKFLKFIVLQE